MRNLLDDFRLLNLKQRNGLYVTNGKTTSLYSASRRCEKMMREKFNENKAFKYDMDRDMLIDKCMDKVNTTEEVEILTEFISNNDCETIIYTLDKTIKKFVAKLRSEATALATERRKLIEKEDNDEYPIWD